MITLIDSINAALAIAELEGQEHNFDFALALVKLKNALEDEVKFYSDTETQLLNKYADKDQDGNIVQMEDGRIKLANAEAGKEYEQELKKLQQTESKTKADLKSLPPERITPKQLMALSKFITFE
jgi:hypothetical protein